MANKTLDSLDHPIVFAFLITLVVLGTSSLLTWGFKSAGMAGPAALSQHA
jgi:hypothetical protein